MSRSRSRTLESCLGFSVHPYRPVCALPLSNIFVFSRAGYRPGKKWKHEDASEMMFDYLIADNDIPMPEEDAAFIKALIAGDPNRWSG
jgi:hypothetical protein